MRRLLTMDTESIDTIMDDRKKTDNNDEEPADVPGVADADATVTTDATNTTNAPDTVGTDTSISTAPNVVTVDEPISLKYIVVGDSCVGKSNLTLRFTKDKFEMQNETTIGVEFAVKLVCVDSRAYNLQIWDTAGQDTFKSITKAYYRNSIGCIIVYDISNRESFEHVREWYAELKSSSDPYNDLQTAAIIGNKMDRENTSNTIDVPGSITGALGSREVKREEGAALAAELGAMFFEVSAKTGSGVRDAFQEITKNIDGKLESGELKLNVERAGTIRLTNSESEISSSSYCSC